jgi:hypothetical protein
MSDVRGTGAGGGSPGSTTGSSSRSCSGLLVMVNLLAQKFPKRGT